MSLTIEPINETAVWISGPKFVEFLESKGVSYRELPGEQGFDDWKKGANLSVWRADKMLTHIGYHILQLPDDCWISNYDRYSNGNHTHREGGRFARKRR